MNSDGIENLLDALPSLTKFKSSFTTSATVFEWIQRRKNIPRFEVSEWSVKPDAFSALLDLLDSYDKHPPQAQSITIHCLKGRGLRQNLYHRCSANYRIYKAITGLTLVVLDPNSGREITITSADIAFSESDEDENEDKNESSSPFEFDDTDESSNSSEFDDDE